MTIKRIIWDTLSEDNPKFYRTNIHCPNCLKAKVLHDTRDNQTYCDNCGQEYILVDKNILRYK